MRAIDRHLCWNSRGLWVGACSDSQSNWSPRRLRSSAGGHRSPGSEAGLLWLFVVRCRLLLTMATTSIDLKAVTAAIEYHDDDAMRLLVKPDPERMAIQFTLHVEGNSAFFDISIPFKYKTKTDIGRTIHIRIDPLSIISLVFSTKTDLPSEVKTLFDSAECLEFRLRDSVAILIPDLVQDPVEVARRQSGIILDYLAKLIQASNLHIYIPNYSLSVVQRQSISTAIAQHKLYPCHGSAYDISRMFGGKGAKSITPRAPLPPSYKTAASPKPNDAPYNESAILNSPNAPSRKRKQGQASTTDSEAIWNRLEQLKTMLNRQTLHDAQTPSLIRMNQELRTEIAQLQEQHASLQKKYEELDSEVASLRQAQVDADDSQDVELVDIRDNIADLENRMDFVERGKDDDELIIRVKDVVLEEMGARIKGH